MKAEEIKSLAFDEAPNDIVRALCMSWCFSKHIPQNAEQHRAAVLEPAIKQAIDSASEVERLRACVAELEGLLERAIKSPTIPASLRLSIAKAFGVEAQTARTIPSCITHRYRAPKASR